MISFVEFIFSPLLLEDMEELANDDQQLATIVGEFHVDDAHSIGYMTGDLDYLGLYEFCKLNNISELADEFRERWNQVSKFQGIISAVIVIAYNVYFPTRSWMYDEQDPEVTYLGVVDMNMLTPGMLGL